MSFSDPFLPTGMTELEKNADLALYLVDGLDRARDPHEYIWRGERDIRTLQYTSHVVEALQRLRLPGLTEHLIESASDWLLDLPLGPDVSYEEQRALGVYPSRFKTLAMLGKFDVAGLREDFAHLSDLLDPDSGWIHNAPLDLSPALLTMIWLDALQHLEPAGLLDAGLQRKRERALAALEGAFGVWADAADAALSGERPLPDGLGTRSCDIANSGDASYALDLLLRAGRLAPDAPRASVARRALTAAIRGHRLGDMRRSDFLYCGLQLREHFPGSPECHEVVESFIAAIRDRYQNHEAQREQLSYQALVLRLLAAHHGPQLHDVILRKLWQHNREAAELLQRQADERLAEEFRSLIRQSIQIDLSRPQRITGTRTRGEVYRARFGLITAATDEHGRPVSSPRDSLRLIVKKGSPDVLARAIERYRELPESLQKLFARHAEAIDGQEAASGYLIMQDLADMQPLSEALADLDRVRSLRREKMEKVNTASAAVAGALRALHGHDRQGTVVSHQLSLTYLAPMAEALARLSQPNAFPELKQWLSGRLQVNQQAFKSLDWYLRQLTRRETELSFPSLGYTHGDCHTRNLMLSRDLSQALFVDIDTLTSGEDYLVDYGLLLEDMIVYQSLPYGNESGRLAWEDIQTSRPDTAATTLEHWIAYPAFPQHTEVVVAFQRQLLLHLQDFARTINDQSWKERLWLAIARGLLLLASRQLTSHSIGPRRRPGDSRPVDDLKLVQVTYAESARLLDELHRHIGDQTALPELPFPGEHRPPPRPPAEAEASSPIGALISAITEAFGGRVERRQPPQAPYFVDYFARPEATPGTLPPAARPFARIHTQRAEPALYLSPRPAQLDDPQQLAAPTGESDLPAGDREWLRARVSLGGGASISAIMALIWQAYQRALTADGGN